MSSNFNAVYNSKPIQTQPESQHDYRSTHQVQSYRPYPVVPPGLETLVEVENVILKKKVFQTTGGKILFTIKHESECCGPPLNIWLKDSRKRDVIKVYMKSHGGCCGNYSYLQIDAPRGYPIGFVNMCNTTDILKFSIQDAYQEPVFTAVCHDPIQIISVKINEPVAYIKKVKEHGSTEIIFQFPIDLDAKMKAVILGAFLYVNFRIREISREQNSTPIYDTAWIADAGDFGCGGWDYGGGDSGGGGWDCGGDFGGGDCGGGGDGGGGD